MRWMAVLILFVGWFSKVLLLGRSPWLWKEGIDYVTGLSNLRTTEIALACDSLTLVCLLFSESRFIKSLVLVGIGVIFVTYHCLS